MKSKRTQSKTAIYMLCIGTALMLTQPLFASARIVKNSNLLPGEEEPVKKNKSKSKGFSFNDNPSVKIYPDAVKKMVHVIAKGKTKKQIDFFVFDMQGTLLQNYKMKSKDRMKIGGLQKGIYLYRVFCGDEETASGNFEIR